MSITSTASWLFGKAKAALKESIFKKPNDKQAKLTASLKNIKKEPTKNLTLPLKQETLQDEVDEADFEEGYTEEAQEILEGKVPEVYDKILFEPYTKQFAELPIATRIALSELAKQLDGAYLINAAVALDTKASKSNKNWAEDLSAHAEFLGMLAVKKGVQIP